MAVVLITDGEERSALALVRSLGAAGHKCIVVSHKRHSLAGASRYCIQEERVASAMDAPDEFVDELAELARTCSADLIIPVAEASILAVLRERSHFGAKIPFPDLRTFQSICNKENVLGRARDLGIAVPQQESLVDEHQIPTIPLPVVLKPTRSVYTRPDGTRGKVGVRWAYSESQLRAHLNAYPREAYPVLAQEVIDGPGVGVFLLMHEGVSLARFAHRRLKEKPPSGGVSVVRQSEYVAEDLMARSETLLKSFGWSGVAMVEYKVNAMSGKPYLMEVNGRFWGSLQLAIDAGVDFPALLAGITLDTSLAATPHYRFVRSRWFWGDVDHILALWGDSAVPWRERLASTAAFVSRFGPGYRSEVLRWRDPKPFMRETVSWFKDLYRK